MTRLVVSEYTQLRDEVRKTLLLGQERIEQEKVHTYWETGRLINEHLRIHKNRAEYGHEVIFKLSKDLGIHESILHRTAEFHKRFPIRAARHKFWKKLHWTHYRALLTVENDEKRFELASRAARYEWNSRELEREIKKLNGRAQKLNEPLTPKKGSFYTYRLIRSEKIHAGRTDLRIDLGFSSYEEASMKGAENFKAGDIALSEWVAGDSYRLVKAGAKTDADLFTYYAYIERVVDGDTILMQVDLGFGVWTRQYLRLRGIDCPELDTSAGRRAKRFVESELSRVPYVVITSSRSDKYDRYLVDVFYQSKTGEQFLNNLLLQHRLAVRV